MGEVKSCAAAHDVRIHAFDEVNPFFMLHNFAWVSHRFDDSLIETGDVVRVPVLAYYRTLHPRPFKLDPENA